MPLIRFPTVKGLVYTIDLSKIADRANPRTVEAPLTKEIMEPCIIDWGDGTSTTLLTTDSGWPEHEYATAGVYTVVVRSATGHLPYFRGTTQYNSDELTNPTKNFSWAIVSIDHFAGEAGNINNTDTVGGRFAFLPNIKNLDTRLVSQTNRTTLNGTFRSSSELEQDIRSFCFDFMTQVGNAGYLFGYCAKLFGSLWSGMFANNKAIASFASAFVSCSGLTGSIPEGLFDNNTSATSFSSTFQDCSGLTGSIPEGLFDNNTLVDNFYGTFYRCRSLTGSIPQGLFDNNAGVTSISSIFYGCSGLTGSIPQGLFDNNTSLENAVSVFAGCSGLTGSIPEGLFDNNTSITAIRYIFQNASGLTGTPYIFWGSDGKVDATKFPALATAANNDPNAITSAYSGCNAALRAQVPTAFGGTMTAS